MILKYFFKTARDVIFFILEGIFFQTFEDSYLVLIYRNFILIFRINIDLRTTIVSMVNRENTSGIKADK